MTPHEWIRKVLPSFIERHKGKIAGIIITGLGIIVIIDQIKIHNLNYRLRKDVGEQTRAWQHLKIGELKNVITLLKTQRALTDEQLAISTDTIRVLKQVVQSYKAKRRESFHRIADERTKRELAEKMLTDTINKILAIWFEQSTGKVANERDSARAGTIIDQIMSSSLDERKQREQAELALANIVSNILTACDERIEGQFANEEEVARACTIIDEMISRRRRSEA